MKVQEYYGYGLNISSEVELPLPKADSKNKPEVSIVLGKTPEDIECEKKISSYSIGQDSFILHLNKFNIFTGFGNKIIIEPLRETKALVDVIPLILSSCIGALLHQRRTLAFHASSVMTEKGAIIFLGGSPTGKSTLAAALSSRGYSVLCDNICPVKIVDDIAVMHPSGECLQVWRDIVNALKIPPESLNRIRTSIEKYYIKNDCNIFKPVNISKIYLLSPTNKSLYEVDGKLSNYQKLNTLKSSIYRKSFAREMHIQNHYYRILKHLANTIPVKVFTKPNHEFNTEKLVSCLKEDFK